MTANEDVLLREIDDELQQDRLHQIWKRFGPLLIGLAVAIVIGVAVYQIVNNQREAARAEAAQVYWSAVQDTDGENPAVAADLLLQSSEQLDGGYGALAALRAAGLLQVAGQRDEALRALADIYGNDAVPDRMRDMARIRAAAIAVDGAPASALSILDGIETEAFAPYAAELEGLAQLGAEDYAGAHATFSALLTDPAAPPQLSARARLLLPVADAGRAGVPLEPQQTEAEAFIDSFTDQLETEGLIPGVTPAPVRPTPPEADGDTE